MRVVEENRVVQLIAKRVLADLAGALSPNDTEASIAHRATTLMRAQGITQTWYYDCPAFVLLGSRSCLSISGRDYTPGDEPVGMTNLITVDLSPSLNGVWGDCARSFFIEDGRCVDAPRLPEFKQGAAMQERLHQSMRSFVSADTTFEDLFTFANTMIRESGFENLDFLGNVGHSIVSRLEDRRYIEAGNTYKLSDAGLFTFEPHIRIAGGVWGFKHEDIYHFGPDGRVHAL